MCQITLKNNEYLIVCSFYRPPCYDIQYATDLCDMFKELCISHCSSLIWLAGDLNLPNVDWKYCSISSNNVPSSLCNIFIDFVLEFGFTQLVDFPTRDQNILDVFFTNHPTHEYTCKPLAGLGDHEIVYITSAVGIELQRPIPRHIYLWHKADFDRIRYLANNITFEIHPKHEGSHMGVTSIWDDFSKNMF